ncbi:MAG: UvrD-helicase domain-containing protein [Mariprofundales bacterium]|nr:UvrD-helicase domain-containing protein [Mariprofundales bacterium]
MVKAIYPINLELNQAQHQAATAGDGPQLILAGAGSGKTRTIIHRIAHLISGRQVAPHRIMAVTFTNRGAQELINRLELLIGDIGKGVVAGTFHAVSLQLLRQFGEHLGYTRQAQVLDNSDRLQLLKQLLKSANINHQQLSPHYLGGWIDQCKNRGTTWQQAPDEHYNNIALQPLYHTYQDELMLQQRMDFSDLILNTLLLLRHHAEVARTICSRFDHILVDEYQDTNPAQHEWLTRLCADHRNLTVVGDDDQSIYGWRGADISNILCFNQQWPDAETHYLEENYRSTAAILTLANAVISHNRDRHPKELRPTCSRGATPRLLSCVDEHDEARTIAAELQHYHQQGERWSQMAVLYRSNRQSLPFEQLLRAANIPYRIVGGTGFFERKEIKDALSYWALLHRCGDALQLKRVINTPRRGIGEKGSATIMQAVAASRLPVADWLDLQAHSSPFKKLQPLAHLLIELRAVCAEQMDGGLWLLLEQVGYIEWLHALGPTESANRIEQLQTLAGAIRQAREIEMEAQEFLDRAALLQGGGEQNGDDDSVNLISIHRAKGLEFNSVFIAGVEEGLLPHQKAIDDNSAAIDEERRLLYVAITRAKKRLTLSHVHSRRYFDTILQPKISRFINWITTSTLQHTPSSHKTAPYTTHTDSGARPITIGCSVHHPSFGEGVVTAIEGGGDAVRVTIEFANFHTKRLMLKHARLTIAS